MSRARIQTSGRQREMRLHRSMVSIVLVASVGTTLVSQSPRPGGLRVEIVFPASAHATPVTGRVYFMISDEAAREPRMDVSQTGIPIFGRDVERLAPGKPATIDAGDLGFPFESLN